MSTDIGTVAASTGPGLTNGQGKPLPSYRADSVVGTTRKPTAVSLERRSSVDDRVDWYAVTTNGGLVMRSYSLAKKPAFFGSATDELFFEAQSNSAEIIPLFDDQLDAELDAILNALDERSETR
jgi:hypothetical protein